jgi:hypothetical protein
MNTRLLDGGLAEYAIDAVFNGWNVEWWRKYAVSMRRFLAQRSAQKAWRKDDR